MQVFLIRHADAVAETVAVRDPHRNLSVHGRVQARELGERMRWHDCSPSHIWTSPLVRAVQTAELVCRGMNPAVAVETLPALAPDGSPRDVLAALKLVPPFSGVMIVGHEPSLSAIGALVAGDPTFRAIAKAEAVRIVDGTVRWRFAWDAEAPAR